MRRISAVAFVVSTAPLLLLLVSIRGPMQTTAGMASRSEQPKAPSELSGENYFAAQVQTLGESEYPNSFAGAVLAPAGNLTVYAVLSDDSSLVASLDALNSGDYPVTFAASSYSFNQLTTMNSEVASLQPQLEAQGVNIQASEPDPSVGTIAVELLQPTATDMANLSFESGESVTSTDYLTVATKVLSSELGFDAYISPGFVTSMVSASGRYDDTPPFYGGDQITGGEYGATCTSGFVVARSEKTYVMTAGHCGTGTWYSNSSKTTKIGSVTSVYFQNSTHDDFSLISAEAGAYVYYDSTDSYGVNGTIDVAKGDEITVDGASTGEVPGNIVDDVGVTVYDISDSLNGSSYTLSNGIIVQSSSGVGICQRGDSGGPMYLREANGEYVKAVGTISAYYGTAEPSPECLGESIGAEMSHSGASILTN